MRNLLTTAILLVCLLLVLSINPQSALAQRTSRSKGKLSAAAQVDAASWSPSAHLRITGDVDNEAFGWPAQIVGDVNGDGFDDLAINSMGNPEGGVPGRLLIYYGGDESPIDMPDWEVSASEWGGEEEFLVGLMLAGAGDVNGDGYDDLAITALDFEEGEQGRLLIYFGASGGPDREPQQIPSPPVEQLIFGLHLWAAGDVNGDGYADLAVAGLDDPENRLLLYLYHGGPDGLGQEPAWTLTDLAALEQYGVGFSAAGDVTGDGFDDVLVGSPAFPKETEQGEIRLYEGGTDGLASQAAWTKAGSIPQGFFGLSVADLGDINGDGHSDLAVSEPNEGEEAGRIVIYLGGADGPQEWRKEYLQVELADGIFGLMVFAAGDVNGDGYADLLSGSIVEGGQDLLLWQLFLGSSEGFLPQPAFEKAFPSTDPDFILLQTVGSGDLNDDGYADLVLSTFDPDMLSSDLIEASPVHIYWGGPGGEEGAPPAKTGGTTVAQAAGSRQIIDDGEPREFFGWPALIVGDVNGDGYDDLAVNSLGNPEAQMAGRVALYLGAQTGVGNRPNWQSSGAGWAEQGEEKTVFAGLAIGAVGDVNGDGYDDMAVTAVDFLSEITHVFVYHGGAGGLDAAPNLLTPPDIDGEDLIFGIRLGAAGDVNGDGYDDLAVLALGSSDGQLQLFVYHGGADGVTGAPAWSVNELDAFQDVGAGFAGVGDVDGDGYADFVVGEPGYPEGEGLGQIRFYAGGPDSLSLEPTWTQEGDRPEAYFGLSVAGLGDVNSDGFGDFAVTEPSFDGGDGRVIIYFGGEPGPDVRARQILALDLEGGVFGMLVFGVGDGNGDGYDDLVVGSGEETGASAMLWQLFHGSSDGLLSTPHLNIAIPGTAEDLLFLTSMGRGDLNGDGYADMALSDVDLEALLDGGFGGGEAIVYYGGSPPDEDAGQSGMGSEAGAVPQPPSAQMAVTDLEIGSEHWLQEGYRYISLSPDGNYILAVNGPILCVLSTDTLLEESCVAWEPTLTSINYGTVTWAPNSRYVALTEDSVLFFYESDIWVLDVDRGKLRNLTDDGVTGMILETEGALVDAAPAWSADSSKLLFPRSRRLEDSVWDGTAFAILDVEDGSSSKIITVTDDWPQAITRTPHWLPDGTTILYSYTAPKESAENGIWTMRQDGADLQQLLLSTDERPQPVLADVSVATGMGLVWYPYLASAREITTSPFGLMDLETGELEELVPVEYEGDGFSGPNAATFSPDGSKLLYTYRDNAGSYYLAVRDVGSGEDAILLRADELMGVGRGGILALDWAASDLIFAGMLSGGGVLLELDGPAETSDVSGQLGD